MEQHLITITKQLLDCIEAKDWTTYTKLCSVNITCFEPEARGHLIEGLPFHQYYFNLPKSEAPSNTSIVNPRVTFLGENSAFVTYVRLIQRGAQTVASEETRIWKKENGQWKNVHFHRSSL
ncbi:camk2d [Acrasis kona]|uniref:Camk2d n=1 Tax=Acrasis kona TaxID=1008807 RepID=A0AAW2YUS9_9EUKA